MLTSEKQWQVNFGLDEKPKAKLYAPPSGQTQMNNSEAQTNLYGIL